MNTGVSLLSVDEDGDISARDNVIVAFFCNKPFSQVFEKVSDALPTWMDFAYEDELRWALIGASSTKLVKFNNKAISRCYSMLTADFVNKKNVFFELMGPQKSGADFKITVKGYSKPKKLGYADQTNLVEFILPITYLDSDYLDKVVKLSADTFSNLQFDSGYLSPAFTVGVAGYYDEAASSIPALALRHPGFDVANNVGTANALGKRSRGARWITMLSDGLVNESGGENELRKNLLQGVDVTRLDSGLMIRAGQIPEIGDRNEGIGAPLLSSVAQAIKAISFFEDNSILPIFGDDEDKRDRWESRFFD